jgi:hypothetical protein
VSTWLIALAGGAVGSILTAALAFGGRLLAAWREIDAIDRFVADRDEDLASWVADRSLALERELGEDGGAEQGEPLLTRARTGLRSR